MATEPDARPDLFADGYAQPRRETLGPGAVLLRSFASSRAGALLAGLAEVVQRSPFRHMTTPGGYRMSVAMTNCGAAGWVTDGSGYRYDALDPLSAACWPQMPPVFRELAADAAGAAGFDEFEPDACLMNRYEPGARLSLHQRSEEHTSELQSRVDLVCRLLLEKKKNKKTSDESTQR